jgi:RNA polymerase sigma-70 factor (ECF subfamily)
MGTPPAATDAPPDRALAEFEAVYRANVAGVTGFFARRCGDPQAVADLTSQTFVEAARAALARAER